MRLAALQNSEKFKKFVCKMEISLVFGLFYCFIYFFIKAYKEILDPYAAFFLAPGLCLQISFNKRSKWTKSTKNRKTFIEQIILPFSF